MPGVSVVGVLLCGFIIGALGSLNDIAVAQRPALQIFSSDLVATEVLRSLLGAMALTLAVPLTTVIAAFTVPEGRDQAPRRSSRQRAKHRR